MTQGVGIIFRGCLRGLGAAGVMAGSLAVATAVVQGAQAPVGAHVQQQKALDSDSTVPSEATGPFVANVAIDSDLLDTAGRRLQPTQRIRYQLSTTDGAEGPSVSVQFMTPPSDAGAAGPITGMPGFRILIDPKGVQLFDPQGKKMPTPSGLDAMRQLATGARQLVLSRASTARRARLADAHGRPSGRVRTLDRFIQVTGTQVLETLVDPTLAVPVELTLTNAGRRVSATRITYGTLNGNRLYRAREVGEVDRTVNPQAPMRSVVTTVHTPVGGGAR